MIRKNLSVLAFIGIICSFAVVPCSATVSHEPDDELLLGNQQFEDYLPLLKNKKTAVFSNQTGIIGNNPEGEHIVDALISRGINVTAIFCPEHGFRGTEDAGAKISDSTDEKTGIPILSLYENPANHFPSEKNMEKFEALVIDIQDIGLSYYTYYISMYYLMDACARYNKSVVILDRPNPNGFYVDGPLLKPEFKSNVGCLPITTVHGMTLGELAKMMNGEGWLTSGINSLNLTVIPCKNYSHDMKTKLIKRPSPNIRDMKAVYLYASTCCFENTVVSVGRGTEQPFVWYGSPYFSDSPEYSYVFTPVSMQGAAFPAYEGQKCYGKNLRAKTDQEIWSEGINLEYIVDAYNVYKGTGSEKYFFGKRVRSGDVYWIDLLFGTDSVRKMIEDGKTAEEIKASWHSDIEAFKRKRTPYIIYQE